MEMHSIEIDDRIWSHLQQNAEPFVDTPNSVLKRLLFGKGEKEKEQDGTAIFSIPAVSIQGLPKSLAQILEVVYEMEEGYSDADIVYVKSWGAFKHYGNFQEEKRLRQPYRKKWICNEEIMEKTRSDSIFMHCLPVRRNIVVTDEVIDGPHSVVYDQAENRLHLQKAILLNLIA